MFRPDLPPSVFNIISKYSLSEQNRVAFNDISILTDWMKTYGNEILNLMTQLLVSRYIW